MAVCGRHNSDNQMLRTWLFWSIKMEEKTSGLSAKFDLSGGDVKSRTSTMDETA